MQSFNIPKKKFNPRLHARFLNPLQNILPDTPQLKSRGHRPLKMTFEDQLHALIFFHLQEHESARDLIQHLKEDDFAKECIAPDGGISRSSFYKIINHRGLEQLEYVFQALCRQAKRALPSNYSDLGELISIDGSLIDAVLTMYWQITEKVQKKQKAILVLMSITRSL